MGQREDWEGSASDLLKELAQGKDEKERQREGWPKKPNGLSGTLRRLAPNLRAAGIEISFWREAKSGKRLITLWTRERADETSSPPSSSSPDKRFTGNDKGHQGDDPAQGDNHHRHVLPPSSLDDSVQGKGRLSGGDDGDDGDDDIPPRSSVSGHAVDAQATGACPVRDWARHAATGRAEGQQIPADVARFCLRHVIPLDSFDLRRTGSAVLRALSAAEAAMRHAP
jgi:hypothetical protein